ncbi:MAG TPA: S-methyl-5'-thioadenosine phosphorylase [Nitrospirae bacterium]|nr:S-methyl-5'-thioadenosine phosphorylase [Nitrospirota bacterium]
MADKILLGIIGGSGLYNLENVTQLQDIEISTPYGMPSSVYKRCKIDEYELVFLSRHGEKHSFAPHNINYRANIWGFKELGVTRIISINSTGGITKNHTPGTIALLDQIIDLTSGARESTYFDSDRVVHIDFTEPFCGDLKTLLIKSCVKAGIAFVENSVYICVNGPRLETSAEIRYFAMIGADVVGMTLMPEAVLARELGICFAGISIVSNKAAGISEGKLTVKEVKETVGLSYEKIINILKNLLPIMNYKQKCQCSESLKDAEM